ncbi:MAG: TMEM175 family protein [Caulobacteraceae bacterium]
MSTDRLGAFSDGVIAVIITIMVLALKAPDTPTFAALVPLWPTAVSYAVSYLFIAIIWVNHHHLLRFVAYPTTRLIWFNFAHLFLVSLVPFATQWVANSRLASTPVIFYALVFVCVDLAYLAFEHEVMVQADCSAVPEMAKAKAHRRSVLTLAIFGVAACAAVVAPLVGMGLICAALSLFIKPEMPGVCIAKPIPDAEIEPPPPSS